MSEIEKYYDSILDKIQQLVDDKKVEEAIFILEDELDAPYIPLEYENKLEDKLFELKAYNKYFKNVYDLEHLSRQQLLKKMVENGKVNNSAMVFFFEKFGNSIHEEELYIFEDILSSKTIKILEKMDTIDLLAYYNADKDMRFYNNLLKKEFTINPTSIPLFETIPLFIETKKLVETLSLKEPTVLNFSYHILYSIYIYFFPTIPEYDYKELSKTIFLYMMKSLKGEELEKNEITELIDKLIVEFE